MEITDFEQFKKTGAKLSSNTISINRALSFGFNSGFYHKNNLKDYKLVVLFYNEKNHSVGFFFTNNEAEGKLKITHSESKTSGGVTARSFFTNYKLDSDIATLAGKYKPQEVTHPVFGKIFIIELDKKLN